MSFRALVVPTHSGLVHAIPYLTPDFIQAWIEPDIRIRGSVVLHVACGPHLLTAVPEHLRDVRQITCITCILETYAWMRYYGRLVT